MVIQLLHQGLRWEEKAILKEAAQLGIPVSSTIVSEFLYKQPIAPSKDASSSKIALVRTPSYFYSTSLACYLESIGYLTINSSEVLCRYGRKILTHAWASENKIPSVPTLIVLSNSSDSKLEMEIGYPLVAKQDIGGFGKMVHKIFNKEHLAQHLEMLNSFAPASHRTLLIQSLLPISKDIRVTFLNNDPIASVYRVAREGDFRANHALGAVTHKLLLSEEIKKFVDVLANKLPRGLLGVDIFELKSGEILLNEINAVPGFKASSEICNINIAREFLCSCSEYC